ncbi:MAG TPA: acetylornithine/succinylornithine family transaminase [Candidatus Limnocylindrales bacterium]|nr:acetylornithine/succinylornithine family transaminase [Candidatus Limnocylindrales bacterium]
MNLAELISLEDRYQLLTYKKFPLDVVRGKGKYVYDSEGKEYLDLYGGHAVVSIGHCHPKLVKAIQDQAEKLIFYSNAVYSPIRAELSKLLVEIAPKGIGAVFFSNSGAEANETALKIARKFTGREEVISLENSFHGRTVGSLSVTGAKKYRDQVRPLLDCKFVPFGDLESVRNSLSEKTAAVMVEAIQSLAGVYMAKQSYYQGLQKLCKEKGALLIFDEVQTMPGRTGAMFACNNWEVTPDLITTAKGIAGGIPMGVTFVKEEIAKTITYGEQGSTFGGGQIACAASKATLEVIQEEKLVENARSVGEYALKIISEVPRVKEVRGLGLLIGVETDLPGGEVQKKLLSKGILVGTSDHPKTIRLLPPLIIERTDIDRFTHELRKIL